MYHAKRAISRCRSLISQPDLPELKEAFLYLWQQAEYVLIGAATYVFAVLVADRRLSKEP